MKNYLEQFVDGALPSFAQCFLVCGDAVRVTQVGLMRYKERFARAGFDIAKIKTAEDLQRALEGSWHIELACLEALGNANSGSPLERAFVKAVESGNEAESERLQKLLERRYRLRLVPNEEACR
jgi:hypothetical protein